MIEEEFQEKDSTSGQELKRTSRGLGVKVHICIFFSLVMNCFTRYHKHLVLSGSRAIILLYG